MLSFVLKELLLLEASSSSLTLQHSSSNGLGQRIKVGTEWSLHCRFQLKLPWGLPVWIQSMFPGAILATLTGELWGILSFQIYKCDCDFLFKWLTVGPSRQLNRRRMPKASWLRSQTRPDASAALLNELNRCQDAFWVYLAALSLTCLHPETRGSWRRPLRVHFSYAKISFVLV